ncbi:MAG: 8-amino-7-oxononanoate synthase [Acidobacteriota bacterium]
MGVPVELQQRVLNRLSELETAGLTRRLVPPTGIDLCSNDYLALAMHTLLKERMAEAVRQQGCGATASRLLRGERICFTALERDFATFKGTAAALYFTSGYAANIGVLTTFLEAGDIVFSDQLNHASLIDGIRLSPARCIIFPHRDFEMLTQLLTAEQGTGQKFLVTESLFSMDGDFAPLAKYAALCRVTNTTLIVDEAHAVGIYGKRGSGLIEAGEIDNDVFISINTAGKALGVSGAFVAGPQWAIDYLVQRARTLIFSTAPSPALAAALAASLELISSEPERRAKLSWLVEQFRKLLEENGVAIPADCSQIIPIILGNNTRAMAIADKLRWAGFDVRAIRPPTVAEGTARLRLTVNINLEVPTLKSFASLLARLMRDYAHKV